MRNPERATINPNLWVSANDYLATCLLYLFLQLKLSYKASSRAAHKLHNKVKDISSSISVRSRYCINILKGLAVEP
jgi:hypothetical protein